MNKNKLNGMLENIGGFLLMLFFAFTFSIASYYFWSFMIMLFR